MFDLKQFTDIIKYVGGNDASSKSDPELFEVKYDQLIQHIKAVNDQCQIYLCNSCPSGDCSTTEVNDLIKSLAEEYKIRMIDVNKTFCDSKKRSLSSTLVTMVSTCQTPDLSVFWAQSTQTYQLSMTLTNAYSMVTNKGNITLTEPRIISPTLAGEHFRTDIDILRIDIQLMVSRDL